MKLNVKSNELQAPTQDAKGPAKHLPSKSVAQVAAFNLQTIAPEDFKETATGVKAKKVTPASLRDNDFEEVRKVLNKSRLFFLV